MDTMKVVVEGTGSPRDIIDALDKLPFQALLSYIGEQPETFILQKKLDLEPEKISYDLKKESFQAKQKKLPKFFK